jgi:hypothetical protein
MAFNSACSGVVWTTSGERDQLRTSNFELRIASSPTTAVSGNTCAPRKS